MDTLARLKSGQLAGTTRLTLSCGLTQFPEEIFELADTLQILDLSGNHLSSLPADLGRLKHLQILFCSNNDFAEVPACVGQCPQLSMIGFKANRIAHLPAAALQPVLRWLILTDNCLEQLPEELGDCTRMQKLMLSGNRLTQLPASLARLENLELLRLSANRLTHLPDWLFTLPRLAWLAYAGNPLPDVFCTPHEPGAVPDIDWTDLQLHKRLGEGASGVIQQALWRSRQLEVAVKLYKGSMTSDGSPLNEMAACIAAGSHPNLIKVEGRVSGHPQGSPGLVMNLIDPSYLNLAGPPSFASCSRDVYADDLSFTPGVLQRMAQGIASVAAQLHDHGINHGDLYAHNILWHEAGDCLFGDFGAACFYPADDSLAARGIERIEVRAFGLLLGEWLERCPEPLDELAALQQACVQPDVLARPGFDEVVASLVG
ncbi:leucine-rich repeat-containing protein kinase family protein [Pseudomonas sp. dw_358]|uniref:leucine-rich repeat-containing protein kinase family protein n=1 Tax=Pseudomonas sp. dw_358 TaxID=2720083 RepID=UPI001BD346E7|nr:leucine-rich repeat-containing protein kinase family protein [Pseudomonas sp. dw_358]